MRHVSTMWRWNSLKKPLCSSVWGVVRWNIPLKARKLTNATYSPPLLKYKVLMFWLKYFFYYYFESNKDFFNVWFLFEGIKPNIPSKMICKVILRNNRRSPYIKENYLKWLSRNKSRSGKESLWLLLQWLVLHEKYEVMEIDKFKL